MAGSRRVPCISGASAAIAPPRGSRSRPRSWRRSPRRSGACRRRARRRRPSAAHHRRRDRAGERADARPRPGARPAGAVRSRQPRADAPRRERRGDRGEHRRRGEAPPLPRPPAGSGRRLGDRLRARRTARPPPGPGRFDVAFRLKENRWNGTIAPQLVVRRVFDAPGAYDELRAWLARGVAGGRDVLDARGGADLRRARSRGRVGEAPAARVGELPGPARPRRRRAAASGVDRAGRRPARRPWGRRA